MSSKDKVESLDQVREDPDGTYLTTNQGVRVDDTDNSLTAGERGPTLMEDFHFREKLTHFDHERIPERIVHARGSGAHGYFQVYDSQADLTRAAFLQDPSIRTPVFVRFSTVVGFRGSADTVRDVRGFATKFYTDEGVYDLVGNNMPVFFIQDGIKFPDLVHAIKPQPHHEMPQASAAHDNFWDFISLTPESIHMILWVLSDRALPRSYAMMEGFGVHTFRLVNGAGKARFVKFHWKPVLGTHALVWDEVQKLAGKDPDYNRRDLWDRIEAGDFPEFELGLQVIEEEDEHRFDFDLLDPTKIVPEDAVPVRIIGKMILNRNPDNFFAETEQVAFHPGHVVPGIDFTNDPLLQARLFSYLDTQLIRLGGPNFAEIPINRPLAPVHNNQRDGYHRTTINKGRTNYSPNSRGGGCPMTAQADQGAFVHYAEKIDGKKIRARSQSFRDHYSQATLFWNSMTDVEKQHIIDAGCFELGKVEDKAIRERMLAHFAEVDAAMANGVARGLGMKAPAPTGQNHGRRDSALSMLDTVKTARTRKVGLLATDGVEAAELSGLKDALEDEGLTVEVVADHSGMIQAMDGQEIPVDKTFLTAASVMYDALCVPGGRQSIDKLKGNGDALHFLNEAFKHCKPIAASSEGVELLEATSLKGVRLSTGGVEVDQGVVTARQLSAGGLAAQVKGALTGTGVGALASAFVAAIAEHRHWDRAQKDTVPA